MRAIGSALRPERAGREQRPLAHGEDAEREQSERGGVPGREGDHEPEREGQERAAGREDPRVEHECQSRSQVPRRLRPAACR